MHLRTPQTMKHLPWILPSTKGNSGTIKASINMSQKLPMISRIYFRGDGVSIDAFGELLLFWPLFFHECWCWLLCVESILWRWNEMQFPILLMERSTLKDPDYVVAIMATGSALYTEGWKRSRKLGRIAMKQNMQYFCYTKPFSWYFQFFHIVYHKINSICMTWNTKNWLPIRVRTFLLAVS